MSESGFLKETKEKDNIEKQEIKSPDFVRKEIRDLFLGFYLDVEVKKGREGMHLLNDSWSEKYVNNAKIFFDELIGFVIEKRDQDSEKMNIFLDKVRRSFFSFSPNLSNALASNEMMTVMAKINRVEELRGFVGQAIIGEFVNLINFGEVGIENKLINKINILPGGLREDLINQLETCYSVALVNDSWASRAVERIEKIIQFFKASEKPLTRIVAESAEERMLDENDRPSISAITYVDNKSAGRLNSHSEKQILNGKLVSNLSSNYDILASSKDVLVAIDHAGLPRYGSFYTGAKKIEELEDLGLDLLQKIKKIERHETYHNLNIRSLINLLGQFRLKFNQSISVEEFYASIFNKTPENISNIIDSGGDITVWFIADWPGIRHNISKLIYNEEEKIKNKGVESVKFESFDKISSSKELSPFGDINENDLLLLGQCLRPEVANKIQQEMGISFSEISFRAIVGLLKFLSVENNDSYQKLISVLNKNQERKNQILEVFIGCSENVVFGEEFLDMCSKSVGGELNIFLDMYSSIVLQSNEIIDLIKKDERRGNINTESSINYLQSAIRKTRQILEQWRKNVEYSHNKNQEYIPNDKIISDLKDSVIQSSVYSSVFKDVLSEFGDRTLEIVGGFDSKKTIELTEVELKEMIDIYSKNYSNNEKLKQSLIDGFVERCKKQNTIVYFLKNKNKIVSFITFEPEIIDEKETGAIYAASFNTDPNYKSSRIGEVVMNSTINKLARENIIHGISNVDIPICSKYIEEGFIGIGQVFNHHGVNVVKIERNDKNEYSTKKVGPNAFVEQFLRAELVGEAGNKEGVKFLDNENYIIEKTNSQKDMNYDLLSEGCVLTRYFSTKEGKNTYWYTVFEKVRE